MLRVRHIQDDVTHCDVTHWMIFVQIEPMSDLMIHFKCVSHFSLDYPNLLKAVPDVTTLGYVETKCSMEPNDMDIKINGFFTAFSTIRGSNR